MNTTQLIVSLCSVIIFVGLGYGMSRSIKKHDARQQKMKKKKGRTKYMPQVKNPGR